MNSVRRTAALLPLLLLLVAASPAAAGDPLDEPESSRFVAMGRIRWSHPQRVSAAMTGLFTRLPTDWRCVTACEFRGFTLQVEPGLDGGQLGAGYARVIGGFGDNRSFLEDVYLALGVQGALLTTWRDADVTPRRQTFLGVEGSFTITRVNASLGIFRTLDGEASSDRWLIAGGLGFGF